MPKFELHIVAKATVETFATIEAADDGEADKLARSRAFLENQSWDVIDYPRQYDIEYVSVDPME